MHSTAYTRTLFSSSRVSNSDRSHPLVARSTSHITTRRCLHDCSCRPHLRVWRPRYQLRRRTQFRGAARGRRGMAAIWGPEVTATTSVCCVLCGGNKGSSLLAAVIMTLVMTLISSSTVILRLWTILAKRFYCLRVGCHRGAPSPWSFCDYSSDAARDACCRCSADTLIERARGDNVIRCQWRARSDWRARSGWRARRLLQVGDVEA